MLFLIGIVWHSLRIRKINQQLQQKSQEITSLNQNLEALVLDRTQELEKRNQQLAEYVFTNSHRVRGPIARILGLMQIHESNGFNSEEEQAQLFKFIHRAAKEDDAVVYEISERLESDA